MKMIAFLGGELSNTATFFSSFATVGTENGSQIDGTFGTEKRYMAALGIHSPVKSSQENLYVKG